MAKYQNDLMLDAALDYLAAATIMCVCTSQPTTYTEMTSTYDLATHVMTGADFTKANGDTSGRKLTTAQQATITIDHTGTALHVALGISGSSTLLYVTTCTSQALTAANTVTVPAFDVEIADAT